MIMAFTEVVNNNNNASNVAMEFRIASKWGYWESWSIEGYMKPNRVETSNVNIKCKKLKMQTFKISFDLKDNICKDIIV
jgi:hypothetical protein